MWEEYTFHCLDITKELLKMSYASQITLFRMVDNISADLTRHFQSYFSITINLRFKKITGRSNIIEEVPPPKSKLT